MGHSIWFRRAEGHKRGAPVRNWRRLLLSCFAALAALPATAGSRDPFTGVWVLDPGARLDGTVSQVLTVSVRNDEETYRSDLLTQDGRRQVTDYVARYDGKEYPSATRLSGGGKPDEARPGRVILHLTDTLTRERYWKEDGRVFRILRRAVSVGGCTMSSQLIHVAQDGTERAGGVLRFTRQDPSCDAPRAPQEPSA